mmetsp:Transcript_79731/g.154106  ORF Transcript_79731/g.154106 Transcript_79731/m.154106 type:complete len:145 (+) Transcript_79731:56-490(+)
MESEYGNLFLSNYQGSQDLNTCKTQDHAAAAAIAASRDAGAALIESPCTPGRTSCAFPGSLSVSVSDSSSTVPATQTSPQSSCSPISNDKCGRSASSTPPRRTAPAAEEENVSFSDAVFEQQQHQQQPAAAPPQEGAREGKEGS